MKKLFFALITALVIPSIAHAQDDPFKHKGHSIDITWGNQTLKNKDTGGSFNSDINVGIRADFLKIKLHKNPIADMLRIRFDVGADINFAKYTSPDGPWTHNGVTYNQKDSRIDWDPMQAELGIAIGPSVQIAPIKSYQSVQFSAFFHVIPSASGIINDTEVSVAYNTFMSTGIAATWKFIGVGYEYRWGSAKYEDKNSKNDTYGLKQEYETSANNVFIRFQF